MLLPTPFQHERIMIIIYCTFVCIMNCQFFFSLSVFFITTFLFCSKFLFCCCIVLHDWNNEMETGNWSLFIFLRFFLLIIFLIILDKHFKRVVKVLNPGVSYVIFPLKKCPSNLSGVQTPTRAKLCVVQHLSHYNQKSDTDYQRPSTLPHTVYSKGARRKSITFGK